MVRALHIGFAGFAAAGIALGVFGSETAAHEMGAMRVDATFAADSSYRIEIVVDGEHLPPGMSPFPSKQFLDGVRLLFDGAPAAPSQVAAADDSRTRPWRTCTVASPGLVCSASMRPEPSAMTVCRRRCSLPPNAV